IRMIENIKRFSAELQVRAFRNIELLFHREVEVRESWADHRILCQISERPCWRQDEHARIKPQRRRSQFCPWRWSTRTTFGDAAGVDLRARSQAGPVRGISPLSETAAAAPQTIGPCISARDVEGNSGAQRYNEVGLPACRDGLRNSPRILCKWQLIGDVAA